MDDGHIEVPMRGFSKPSIIYLNKIVNGMLVMKYLINGIMEVLEITGMIILVKMTMAMALETYLTI
jgi:hypothetical protein